MKGLHGHGSRRWPARTIIVAAIVLVAAGIVTLLTSNSTTLGSTVPQKPETNRRTGPSLANNPRLGTDAAPTEAAKAQATSKEEEALADGNASRGEFIPAPPGASVPTDEAGWRAEYARLLERKIDRWESSLRPACDGIPVVESAIIEARSVRDRIARSAASAQVGLKSVSEAKTFEQSTLWSFDTDVCNRVRAAGLPAACENRFAICNGVLRGQHSWH